MSKPTPHATNFGRFDYVKLAPLMGGISVLLTIVAIAILAIKGLNYGIDFSGGTEMQIRFEKPVEQHQLRLALEEAGIKDPGVQRFGSDTEFLVRLETPKAPTEKETNEIIRQNITKIKTTLTEKFGLTEGGILRVDSVGPQVGSELKRNGLLAVFYSLLLLLIYIAVRFDYKYAPGAILCLAHDAVLVLGIYSLFGFEFNVQIMAAILTLIGYSLNDTIVTFDRIRETTPEYRKEGLRFTINKAINDMMSRTILTALATMLAVVSLYLFGGGVISQIAFALMIGILFGVYSSIYVAAPLILVMEKFKRA